MKPSWKGSLAFGLVDIRVELYSAVTSHALSFKLLHRICNTPITYHRWCDHCHKEVAWEDVEKGIQLRDGTFFVITPAHIKKLKPQKTDTISIVEFVDDNAIDPVLMGEHYYILPAKASQPAFFLFAAALERLGKVAIGQFVLREKEYVGMIRSYRNVLLLTTLNYGYEVKKIPSLNELRAPKIQAKELTLAEQLIGKLSHKTFNIDRYKDTFATKLVRKIQQLKKGIAIPTKKKELAKPHEISLMKSLQESLKKVPKKIQRSKLAKR